MEDSKEFDKKILTASSESIRKMLAEIDMSVIARALFRAPVNVVNKITEEQSNRAKGLLTEAMNDFSKNVSKLESEAEYQTTIDEAKTEVLKQL